LYPNLSFNVVKSIFDSKIAPIACYGSEIWGYTFRESIEKVQTLYFKRYLSLSNKASSNAVLGEVGRYHLSVNYFCRCIRYWCRLLHMDSKRYPHACYKMLKIHDENGSKNWASHVRMLLFETGFAYAWISQECGDVSHFMSMFKQRCIDINNQNWHYKITNSYFLSHYASYKSLLQIELYLTSSLDRDLVKTLAKFRCLMHGLKIQKQRFTVKDIESELLYCKNCSLLLPEDEYHFVLICPKYRESRESLIPRFFYQYPSRLKLNLLMCSSNMYIIKGFALYVKRNLPIALSSR